MDSFNSLKSKILDELETVEAKEYIGFMSEAFKLAVSDPDLMRMCMNKLAKIRKEGNGGSDEQGNALSRPPKPLTPTKSAWELPLIFRGDLVPTKGRLFIDVEKVSERKTHRNLAATVAVVDSKRELILWAFIKREGVCQFFPKLTNLSKEKVGAGVEISQVTNLLNILLADNTVYGAAVEEDLMSLDVNLRDKNICAVDIQDFYRDTKGPYKLADIAKAEFPNKESFQCGMHSAIADARMTQKVVKKMLKYMQEGHRIYPKLIERSVRPKKIEVGDKCTCGVTKKKYKKKASAPSMDWRDSSWFHS